MVLLSIFMCCMIITTIPIFSYMSTNQELKAERQQIIVFHTISYSLHDAIQQTDSSMNLEVKLLANDLQNILNNSAAILEITSKTSAVKNIPYGNSINSAFHGIPRYLDLAKRNLADVILSKDKKSLDLI